MAQPSRPRSSRAPTVRRDGIGAAAGLALAALAVAALPACRGTTDIGGRPPLDSTGTGGTGAPGRLRVALVEPAARTSAAIAQRGLVLRVAFADSAGIAALRVVGDSGTPVQRDFTGQYAIDLVRANYVHGPKSLDVVVYAPSAGVHAFTVVATDVSGVKAGATITRAFALPDAPYTATVLPDLGYGAGPVGLDAAGDVAGWVLDATGRRRPAVWSGGVLRIVPAADGASVVATRVDAAGDVLLQYASRTSNDGARVRRADGTELLAGPLDGPGRPPGSPNICCAIAADLNERRQALGTTPNPEFAYRTAVLDVPRGVLTDSVDALLTTINDEGQAAGTTVSNPDALYRSVRLFTRGFTAPTLPSGAQYSTCDLPGRFSQLRPIDLDNSANLLADYCGNPVLLGATVPTVAVDRFVGRGQVHLARAGGLVASLDSTGAVFLWRLGTTEARTLRVADAAWRLDSLGGVNARGQIAVRGVAITTGRPTALLLTPAAP